MSSIAESERNELEDVDAAGVAEVGILRECRVARQS